MVSSSRQTFRRRQIVKARRSRHNKDNRFSTPAFPVHPAGYDAQAPDAKKKP